MGVLPCRRGGGLVSACGTGSLSWESLVNRYWSLREKTYKARGCMRVPGGHRLGGRVCRCWQSLGSRSVAAPSRFPVTARF